MAFIREIVHRFSIGDKTSFFSSTDRARMVYDILQRTGYDSDERGKDEVPMHLEQLTTVA